MSEATVATEQSPPITKVAALNTDQVAVVTKGAVQKVTRNALQSVTDRHARTSAKAALYKELLPIFQDHDQQITQLQKRFRTSVTIAAGSIAVAVVILVLVLVV